MAKVSFTGPKVGAFTCPPGKSQAFLWDSTAPGLGLRATPAGKPAYIFQSVYRGKTIRLTIGSPEVWQLEDRTGAAPDGTPVFTQGARGKAKALQRCIDDGKDPRDLKRNAIADTATAIAAEAEKAALTSANAITVGEVWVVYVEERRPHWGDLHHRDHIRKAAAGGVPFKRGTGTTAAGPLHTLMGLPLRDLTAPTVEAWAAKEAKTRPTSARLALRMLKAFLGWCEEVTHPETETPLYSHLLPTKNPAKTTRTREHLGKAKAKSDALQREQLTVWFDAVRKVGNPIIAAYLQTVLLTGARPGEVIKLGWEDLNTKWKGLTIRDKVEGTRVIPLTPYVHSLLAALPRRTMTDIKTGRQIANPWVFSSPTSDTGHITEPNHAHTTACTVAGIDGLTLHGLRRSFKSLTEWLEIPVGVVAQVMGHKPSATAEKHYTVRPLDLLRVHHEKIEAWILEQAGIVFDAKAAPGKLRAVAK